MSPERVRELATIYRDDAASVSHDNFARILLTGAVALETAEILEELRREVGRGKDLRIHAERCEEAWNTANREKNEYHDEVEALEKEMDRLRAKNFELIKANAEVANLFVGHETLLAAAKDAEKNWEDQYARNRLWHAIAACEVAQ